jgi:hypothetical protein
LPELPFEPCDKRPAKVSSTALVRYRMNEYSAPTAYGFRDVLVGLSNSAIQHPLANLDEPSVAAAYFLVLASAWAARRRGCPSLRLRAQLCFDRGNVFRYWRTKLEEAYAGCFAPQISGWNDSDGQEHGAGA